MKKEQFFLLSFLYVRRKYEGKGKERKGEERDMQAESDSEIVDADKYR